MKIKCYSYDENDGTWIIDTVREYRKAISAEYKTIEEYNKAVLEDVEQRIPEKIISRFEIIEH